MELKKNNGFTLIELLVVVAIVGLLAAVAIPKYGNLMEKANLGATLGNLSTLRSSVSIFYGTYTELPNSIDVAVDERFAIVLDGKLPGVKAKHPVGMAPFGNEVETGIDVPTEAKTGWYYNSQQGYVYINSIEIDSTGEIYSRY